MNDPLQSLTITKPEREDIAELTRLINSAYRGGSARGWTSEEEYMEGLRVTEADLERLFSHPETDNFKCCAPGGEIIGFVSLEKCRYDLHLGLLTVSPELQAAGIGRQLLEFAEEYGRSISKPAILMTVVNIRTELIAWYERRGYLATGETLPFPEKAGKPKVPIYLIEMKKEICG
jgi:GNAT superfamily N-acetyltransferase